MTDNHEWLAECNHRTGGEVGPDDWAAVAASWDDACRSRDGFRAKPDETAFEAAFAQHMGLAYARAYSAGGTALFSALWALGVGPGDEVIYPAITFFGAAMPAVMLGARVRLADVDPATLCMTARGVAEAVTHRTKTVVLTHMNGFAADVTAVRSELTRLGRPDVSILVDAARAHGDPAFVQGADVAIFSFNMRKHMTTLGQGGMAVTGDDSLGEKLRTFRRYGKNVSLGMNLEMTKLQSAMGTSQLAKLPRVVGRRRELVAARRAALPALYAQTGGRASTEPTYYRDYVLLPEADKVKTAADFVARMRREGIGCEAAEGVIGMHQPSLRPHLVLPERLPGCSAAAAAGVYLPLHSRLTDADNARLIDLASTILA